MPRPNATTTARAGEEVLWHDDFADGISVATSDARWRYVQARADLVANDAELSIHDGGLRLVSAGRNPRTGAPAFTRTVPGDHQQPGAVPGFADHAKWIAYANVQASSGFQGFDAVPGTVLSCSTTLSGRTHGTAEHPFGDAVEDPEADLRLAAAMLNTIDPETSVAFDFVLTSGMLYAFYGRTNFARRTLGRYGSFACTVPLVRRTPTDRHRVELRYDRSAGEVRWLVEGEEMLRVDRIGMPLDRTTLTLDEGGELTVVEPRQLSFGMGMMNLLDGSWPTGRGLVRLSTATTYYRPDRGEPHEQRFVDEESREDSRLFGQGAELWVSDYTVTRTPSA